MRESVRCSQGENKQGVRPATRIWQMKQSSSGKGLMNCRHHRKEDPCPVQPHKISCVCQVRRVEVNNPDLKKKCLSVAIFILKLCFVIKISISNPKLPYLRVVHHTCRTTHLQTRPRLFPILPFPHHFGNNLLDRDMKQFSSCKGNLAPWQWVLRGLHLASHSSWSESLLAGAALLCTAARWGLFPSHQQPQQQHHTSPNTGCAHNHRNTTHVE